MRHQSATLFKIRLSVGLENIFGFSHFRSYNLGPVRKGHVTIFTSQCSAAPGCGYEGGGGSGGLWGPSPSSRASPWWSSPSSSCQTLWSDSDWCGSGRLPEAHSSPLLRTSQQCRSSTGPHRTGALVESEGQGKIIIWQNKHLDLYSLTRCTVQLSSIHLLTNLHYREESIQQADGQREGVRVETKEPGQREQVLHLQLPQSSGHPEAVVLGGLNEPQAAQLWLVSALQICQGFQLNRKGLCSRCCHCVNHLRR